jgi:tetratricopeptide (TPR) repeat protein
MKSRKQALLTAMKKLHVFFVLFCLTASFTCVAASAQCALNPPASGAVGSQIDSEIQQRFSEKNWNQVVRLAESLGPRSADTNFAYGMALAHLSRWQDARAALLAGHRLCPRQERFPLELAGIAFQLKHNPEAAHWLLMALHLEPSDEYANNFAGTVYLLMGNTSAALKYWNRVNKPQIAGIAFDPQLHVQRLLLDRAFAFSPAAMLHLEDYETTQARLDALGIFPSYNIVMNARTDGKFDVQFHTAERNGFGSGVLQSLISTFSGVAYETVYPAYYNIDGTATNIESLLRWDSQKRRAWLKASGPLHNRPEWHGAIEFDIRDENWAIRRDFTGIAPVLGSFDLERQSAAASFTAIPNGRVQWSAGAELSHRTFHNVVTGTALTPALVTPGFALTVVGSLQSKLFEFPEHRFNISTSASSELGRIWPGQPNAPPSTPGMFGSVQGTATAQWLPQAQGDRFELQQRIRAGRTFNDLPIDKLYLIGMERDTDLWLRGHVGTRDGRKGSSPLATNYFLTNFDFFRRIYSNGLITIKAGPLFDIARTTAPTSGVAAAQSLAATQWFYDTGAHVKLTVLGTSLVFTWGRDLRTGNNAFYGTTARP